MIYDRVNFQEIFKVVCEVTEYDEPDLNHDYELFRQNLINSSEVAAKYGVTDTDKASLDTKLKKIKGSVTKNLLQNVGHHNGGNNSSTENSKKSHLKKSYQNNDSHVKQELANLSKKIIQYIDKSFIFSVKKAVFEFRREKDTGSFYFILMKDLYIEFKNTITNNA